MPETDYDRVDYGGSAHMLTSPNRLAGMSGLLGVPCAAPGTARVLELACGNAANLIPLAWYWPQAEFVGIDLAHTTIVQGRAQAQSLGLRNLRLEQGDITALSAAQLGQFDYVIAHGLLSWVPGPVREATLRLIGELLSPSGIGYVSYNAYPGSRIRHLVREMMQFHLGDRPHSMDTAKQAWQLLESMDDIDPAQRASFLDQLQEEGVNARKSGINFLFHDDLSIENQPLYLHEFVAMAQAADLAYLGDADIRSMVEPEAVPTLTRWLDQSSGGDWVRRQQYLDFALGTRFRRSLVCRRDRAPRPCFALPAIDGLRICSSFRPESAGSISDDSEMSFREPGGRTISTNNPMLKTVLAIFAATPGGTLGVNDLAVRLADATPEQALAGARALLHRLIMHNLAYPLGEDPPGYLDADAEGSPITAPSALTRQLIDRKQPMVDNLHASVKLSEPWVHELLQQIDGQRDALALSAIASRLSAGTSGAAAANEMANGLTGLLEMLRSRGLCSGGPGPSSAGDRFGKTGMSPPQPAASA